MRILNRPMFRYGGPIREGVMHGMRSGGRAALVGNPVYPKTGGREHHSVWKTIFGAGAKPVVGGASKPGFIRTQAPKAWEKIKSIFGSTTPGKQPGIFEGQILKTPSTPGSFQMHPFWARDPLVKSALWTKGALTSPTAKNIGQKIVQGVATPTGIGLTFLGGKWLWSDGKEASDDEINEHLSTGGGEGWDPGAGGQQYIDPKAAEKLAKAAQNKRLKSYLDMMGYDSAKRGAIDKALIDASALVQDATTEAGSIKHADWGKLVNRMIQTTSKRMDKPEQIREAVGLMMTKGAIEKDIADAKGTPLDIKEKYLVEKLGKVGGERGALGKPTSLSEALNLTKASDTTANRTNQALRHYFDGHLVPSFKGKISKKKLDALGGDEILEEGTEIGLDNGVYQISNSYIIVQGNKIIERDDVFASEN